MDKADPKTLGPQSRPWSLGTETPKDVSEAASSSPTGLKKQEIDETHAIIAPSVGSVPLDTGLKPPARLDDSADTMRGGLPEIPSRPFPKLRRTVPIEDPVEEAVLAAAAVQAVAIPIVPPPAIAGHQRSNPRIRAPKSTESTELGAKEGAETIIASFRQKMSLLLRVMAFGAALVMAARVAIRELRAFRSERTASPGRDGVDGKGRRFRLWLR